VTKLRELKEAMAQGDHRKVELIALAAVKELERKKGTTWLTPVSEAYEEVMGKGSFPFGQAAKLLAPLSQHYPPEKIGAHLGMYLRSLKRRDEMRFLSLARFSQTFNSWDPDEPAFDDKPL
jgi:hypothetical protein